MMNVYSFLSYIDDLASVPFADSCPQVRIAYHVLLSHVMDVIGWG